MAERDIPSTMTAVVLTGPGEWEIQQVPTPEPAADEILCRVHAVAICGTDPKIVKGVFKGMWPPTYPAIIGHEWAGEVVALSDQVAASATLAKKYAPGTHVAGEAHKGCGLCENCMKGRYTICLNYGDLAIGHRHYGFTAPGAYAEYIRASIKSLHPMPESLTFEDGAMLDAAGTAFHAIERGRLSAGEAVVVLGPGAVGNITVQLAKAAGAKQVIMIGRGPRLESAVKVGAIGIDYEKVEDPVKEVWRLTGVGGDVVIDCAGTQQSCQQAIQMTRKGGRVVMSGLPAQPIEIPWAKVTLDEMDMLGVRANPNVSDACMALVANGSVDAKSIHTHTFALSEFGEALATFIERRQGAMKVVLKP